MVCHNWFFKNEFRFQDSVCNGCHDLIILWLHLSDIAIINVKNVDYCLLFMTLANLKQFVYQKFIMCLMIVGLYKRHINLKNQICN